MAGKVIGLGILLELVNKVTGPAGKISRAFNDVERTARMADKAVAFAKKNWSTGWRVALAGTAMTALFVGANKSILDVNAQLERFQTQLITAKAGSVEAGNALLEWAKKFSALTPFEIPQVVEATAQLEIYGINAKKWLPLIGNMAGSMSKDVNSAAYGVAKALTGGGFDVLRETFGITGQALVPFGFKGKMSTPAEIANLASSLEKFISTKFAGGMERMAKTWTGLWSMVSDAIFQIKAAAGAGLFGKLKVDLSGFVKLIQSPAFQESAARWGKIFGDAMSIVVDWVKKLLSPLILIINYIDKLTKTHPEILKYAAAFTFVGTVALTAFGGLMMFASGIGWIAFGVLKTIVVLKSLGFVFFAIKYYSVIASTAVWSFFLTATKAVLVFMTTNPVGWVLLAISAIVMFALAWKNNWLGIGTFMNKVVGGIASAFVWLWNQIMIGVNWIISLPGKFYDAGKSLIISLWEGIKSVAMWPVKAIEKIVEKIGKFIIFHSPPVEGALKDIDKFGSAFADEITVGVARNLHRIRNTAFAAGAAAMMAYSAGFGSSEIAPPPGMGPMGTLAYDIARTTIATSPQPLVVAKPPLDIATVPLPPDYWYVPLPSKIKTDTGITNGSIGSLEAGGAASGLGGIGGGITSYFTQHFERGSIILNAQHLDFESFADMVAKAVERKIKGD